MCLSIVFSLLKVECDEDGSDLLSTPKEAAFYSSDGDVEDGCGFVVAEFFDVAEGDYFTVIVGESVDCFEDLIDF